MPQVLAALVRSAPSRTIASANIRRDAALFFSRPAATRSSMAVKSLWVTAIAAIVLAPLHTKNPSIQTFSDSGIPTSHPFSPLVLHHRALDGAPSERKPCEAGHARFVPRRAFTEGKPRSRDAEQGARDGRSALSRVRANAAL